MENSRTFKKEAERAVADAAPKIHMDCKKPHLFRIDFFHHVQKLRFFMVDLLGLEPCYQPNGKQRHSAACAEQDVIAGQVGKHI